jgi:acetyl-CoA carboxylase carboxyltransferase component
MGAAGAVNIVHRKRLQESEDKSALRAELVEEYRDRLMNPYVAAATGMIDDVIEPAETRPKIIRALEMLRNKREVLPPKKHGSIPL